MGGEVLNGVAAVVVFRSVVDDYTGTPVRVVDVMLPKPDGSKVKASAEVLSVPAPVVRDEVYEIEYRGMAQARAVRLEAEAPTWMSFADVVPNDPRLAALAAGDVDEFRKLVEL